MISSVDDRSCRPVLDTRRHGASAKCPRLTSAPAPVLSRRPWGFRPARCRWCRYRALRPLRSPDCSGVAPSRSRGRASACLPGRRRWGRSPGAGAGLEVVSTRLRVGAVIDRAAEALVESPAGRVRLDEVTAAGSRSEPARRAAPAARATTQNRGRGAKRHILSPTRRSAQRDNRRDSGTR